MYGRDIMEKDIAIYIYIVGLKLVGAHVDPLPNTAIQN